ncbi:hypothetical protein [Rhizobium lusitanum]
MPVFNLEVEGAHCFFANGILVHNCDSVTQALKHLRDAGLLIHGSEMAAEMESDLMGPVNSKPLYPV